jgi:hypothetical protein
MRFPISVITSAIKSSITPELIYVMYVNLFPSYIIWVFHVTRRYVRFCFQSPNIAFILLSGEIHISNYIIN